MAEKITSRHGAWERSDAGPCSGAAQDLHPWPPPLYTGGETFSFAPPDFVTRDCKRGRPA